MFLRGNATALSSPRNRTLRRPAFPCFLPAPLTSCPAWRPQVQAFGCIPCCRSGNWESWRQVLEPAPSRGQPFFPGGGASAPERRSGQGYPGGAWLYTTAPGGAGWTQRMHRRGPLFKPSRDRLFMVVNASTGLARLPTWIVLYVDQKNKPVDFDLNHIDSYRLIPAHTSSCRLISTHIDSYQLIPIHIDPNEPKSTHVCSFRLTSTHIDSCRLISTHTDSYRLISTHIDSNR